MIYAGVIYIIYSKYITKGYVNSELPEILNAILVLM